MYYAKVDNTALNDFVFVAKFYRRRDRDLYVQQESIRIPGRVVEPVTSKRATALENSGALFGGTFAHDGQKLFCVA